LRSASEGVVRETQCAGVCPAKRARIELARDFL
jgi:hypothetical protein